MKNFKRDITAILIVSVYLIIYCILLLSSSTELFAVGMWMLSPFLIIWMVWTVLKHGKYNGKELGEREYGYQDRE